MSLTKFYKEKQTSWEQVSIRNTTDLTSGWETELYRFILEYIEGNRSLSKCLVARLYPGRGAVEKAKREFGVMKRLGKAGYPVPAVHDVETDLKVLDMPFITMDWIEGHSMMDDFQETSIEEIRPHLEVFTNLFVDLHHVNPTLVFPEFPSYEDTLNYLDLTLKRIRNSFEERGPPWIEPVLEWLEEGKHEVSPGRFSVLHRDFHPGNIMVRPDGSHAVIDWGASSLGDPREDLMWTVLLARAFWGRSFGENVLEAYQRASGEEVMDLGFFEVIAIYRRIHDTAISFIRGAEEMGMRSGAVEQMKGEIAHLHSVHRFLEERTGITLSDFDEILTNLQVRL
jgi:aminoglycoside phosphotransferase (APT) family kinase protein